MQDLARKYRPRTLDELVGQPVVVQTLANAVKNQSLHKAHLFVGQIGSGKTSTARILAAMENCEISPGLHPCGTCGICTKIFNGNHTDVKEVDSVGISGEGAKQVRELVKDAYYNPVDGCRTKYFIFDECLPSEALISMSDGSEMPIGELVERGLIELTAGEVVRSRDMETGEIIDQEIIRYIKIPNNKQMYEIKIEDKEGNLRTVRITGNHNIFVEGEEKIQAKNLVVGQEVFLE